MIGKPRLSPTTQAAGAYALFLATFAVLQGWMLLVLFLEAPPLLGAERIGVVLSWALAAALLGGGFAAGLWKLVLVRRRRFTFLRGGLAGAAVILVTCVALLVQGHLVPEKTALVSPFGPGQSALDLLILLSLPLFPFLLMVSFILGGLLAVRQAGPTVWARWRVYTGLDRTLFLSGRQLLWALAAALASAVLWYAIVRSWWVALMTIGVSMSSAWWSPHLRESRPRRLLLSLVNGGLAAAGALYARYALGVRFW